MGYTQLSAQERELISRGLAQGLSERALRARRRPPARRNLATCSNIVRVLKTRFPHGHKRLTVTLPKTDARPY